MCAQRQNDAPPLLHFSDKYTACLDMISHLASFSTSARHVGKWNSMAREMELFSHCRSDPNRPNSALSGTLFGEAVMPQTEHRVQKISNIHSFQTTLELSHRCQAYLRNLALLGERES